MKQGILKPVVFFGKSMIWSLLMYVIVMLVIYREEVSNTITGRSVVAAAQTPAPLPDDITPASISDDDGLIGSITRIIKTISGLKSVTI